MIISHGGKRHKSMTMLGSHPTRQLWGRVDRSRRKDASRCSHHRGGRRQHFPVLFVSTKCPDALSAGNTQSCACKG